MHEFTVLIPTHNRHDYLQRSISYFKQLEANVLYCDSSVESYKGNLAQNMKYVHMPGAKFADKILTALELIDNDIVALCADDDFIIRESLCLGFKFLEQKSEYKLVLGNDISFHENFDGSFYQSGVREEKVINFGPLENASIFFNDYRQVLWGMYRRALLIEAFEIIRKLQFRNDNFIEITLGALACYRGAIKCLSATWSVRELSGGIHWGDRHVKIRSSFGDPIIRYDMKRFTKEVNKATELGFAEEVIRSYLGLSKIAVLKLKIRGFLKGLFNNSLKLSRGTTLRGKGISSFEKYPDLKSHEGTFCNSLSDIKKILLSSVE